MCDIYYKIYLTEQNKIEICCLQWFDESGYTENRWLSAVKFNSELEAEQFLQECKLDKIKNETVVSAIKEYLKIPFKHILDREEVNE